MQSGNQAETLKKIARRMMNRPHLRTLAVSSGKGGVGKTNVVANLAYALSKQGRKTLVVDADLGLNNIDILLGLAPKFHIGHALSGEKTVDEIIIEGPGGIHLLPAGDGLQELTQLDTEKKMVLMDELDRVSAGYDFLLFDTGAGISTNVTYFCSAANEIILVVTAEPTSLTDVYALIKILNKNHAQKHFRVIINSVKAELEAQRVFRHLTAVTDKFLSGVSVEYLGHLVYDPNVSKAVRRQQPFLELYPHSKVGMCMKELANKIANERQTLSEQENRPLFWRSALQIQ
ncbi:MAG: MinD/ParA family protein [Candidatus Nitrohelix vancouverensis]|uniref:MinD/ParA family protein n=1 Tax=Candidatus Nitrohelix vancouverensis TaxID=2705534 RepID=A0A7T0G3I7_9BACT|nr:MAG: MinD/ParA family protein [Candidatus Nitrohelix vancouverensis]